MPTRRVKQVLYGGFYLVILLVIGYGVYRATLKPAPTCFDNKLNGEEVEVDCGGPICQPCAIKRLQPIRILPAKVLQPSPAEGASALFEFQNPNPGYGASRFGYKFFFYSTSSSPLYIEEGETIVYPSEVQYKVLANLPFSAPDVSIVAATSTFINWKPAADLSMPKTQIRDLKLEVRGNKGFITGILRNENSYPILIATLNGIVSNKNRELVAVSKTQVRDLDPIEERAFQIVLLLPPGVTRADLADPKVTVEARR